MREIAEIITSDLNIFSNTIDIVLVSEQLNSEGIADNSGFSAFSSGADFAYLCSLTIDDTIDISLLNSGNPQSIAIVVGGDFTDWPGVCRLANRLPSGSTTEICVLTSTGSSSISLATLDQFETELSIRAEAAGLKSAFRRTSLFERSKLQVGEALAPSLTTSLGKFLMGLDDPEPDQLVAFVAPFAIEPTERGSGTPFFTVLTRTQGKRMDTLREVFLCLASQTFGDLSTLLLHITLKKRRRTPCAKPLPINRNGFAAEFALRKLAAAIAQCRSISAYRTPEVDML